MSIDQNVFDCLLDPLEIFAFYQRIGVVLNNNRDIVNERVRGQALHNTLELLQKTGIIEKSGDEYKKSIDCSTLDLFFSTLIVRIKSQYGEEVSSIINCNKHFDETKKQFFIYVNDVPLKLMGLAMLLEQNGEFKRIKNRLYFASIDNYREIIKKKPLVSIEELQKKLSKDIEIGERAENFALKFEISRLKRMSINKKPFMISSIDVMAGYDMISYESLSSEGFDRFIEVKAISSNGFFWSKNEYEVAKFKGDKYYLYLVDLRRIGEVDYVPEIVQDPANNIMKNDDWFVEAQSYHIRHI